MADKADPLRSVRQARSRSFLSVLPGRQPKGKNSCYLSPTASRSVGTRYPGAAGYSAMPCNATYCSVTSCLLATTVTVVAIEAAEMVFQMVFQNDVLLDGDHGGHQFVLPRVMNVEHAGLPVSAVFRFGNCLKFL
jgi:hypothetical protein